MTGNPISEPEEETLVAPLYSSETSGASSPSTDCSCTCIRIPVVDPQHSCWLFHWDLGITVLLVLTAIAIPYDVVFLSAARLPGLRALRNLAIDLYFILDVVLQFFIRTVDKNNMAIKDRQGIARAYLCDKFWIDLASVLPLDLVPLAALPPDAHQYLALARLLRLTRIHRITERWRQQLGIKYAIISLVNFCCLLTLFSHWSACVWGYFALNGTDGHNWLAALQAAKGGPEEFYAEPHSIYILSLYWALVTTTSIGYGDITPQNFPEYVYSLVAISLLGCLWAYVIGAVCSIMSTLQPLVVHYRHTMDSLNYLMDENDIPTALRVRLREYFHRAQYVNHQRTQKKIIDQMSPQLQGEVHAWINDKWLSKVSYFNKCGSMVVSKVARSLTARVFPPDEDVANWRTLFILRRGLCSRKGRVLSAGCVWGEDMLLSNSHLREDNLVHTLSYCDMLMLHASQVLATLAHYPDMRAPIMWAKAKFGLKRAIILIARRLTSLPPEALEVFNKLPGEQRGQAYRAIINDEFTPKWLERNVIPDKPFLESEPNMYSVMQAINGIRSNIEHLVESQATLAITVGELTGKVAELQFQFDHMH